MVEFMLSEKLKKYRADNNLTQEEFASLLFVTRNAVSKWENNIGYPNIDTIKDIAKEDHSGCPKEPPSNWC